MYTTAKPVKPSRHLRIGLCAALLLPFAGAEAAVRCVENVEQLKVALDQALASANAQEEVRIKSGDYYFTSGDMGYFGLLQGTGKTLTVSGGWSGGSGQCSNRTGTAATTVLYGMAQRSVFGINASHTFTGTLVIEDIGFTGGFSADPGSTSCLGIGEQNGGVMTVRLDRIRVEHCVSGTSSSVPSAQVVTTGGLIVRNSLVVNNDAGISLPLSVMVKGGSGWVLNNTVADNVSANINGFVGIGAGALPGTSLRLANNLLDRNVATAGIRRDLRVAAGVSLRNNRFTGLFGTPDENIGSSSGAAGFDGSSYELVANSPARDSGALHVPSLQGSMEHRRLPRITGSAVDLGAFEFSPLHGNGFE